MKPLSMIIYAFMALCFCSCNPHQTQQEVIPKHARPGWINPESAKVESSMTITGMLPIRLVQNADTTDMVAAFQGQECCGVTSIQWVLGQPYYFLTVLHSETSDRPTGITLRYYSTYTQYIYVEQETVDFLEDQIIGSIDSPFVAEFLKNE